MLWHQYIIFSTSKQQHAQFLSQVERSAAEQRNARGSSLSNKAILHCHNKSRPPSFNTDSKDGYNKDSPRKQHCRKANVTLLFFFFFFLEGDSFWQLFPSAIIHVLTCQNKNTTKSGNQRTVCHGASSNPARDESGRDSDIFLIMILFSLAVCVGLLKHTLCPISSKPDNANDKFATAEAFVYWVICVGKTICFILDNQVSLR